ncbi:MAG: hypothetical protein ACRDP4_06800, partial [Nocardioidaceae bacterium]
MDGLTDQVVAPHLATVSDALAKLQHEDLWRLDGDQALAATRAAYELVEQAHAAALELLAETNARSLAREAGASSTQAWLSATRRMRPGVAKRDVETAKLVRHAVEA